MSKGPLDDDLSDSSVILHGTVSPEDEGAEGGLRMVDSEPHGVGLSMFTGLSDCRGTSPIRNRHPLRTTIGA